MRIQLNGVDLASGELSVPSSGAWTLQARMADFATLTQGDPFSLTADNVAVFKGFIYRLSVFAERVRITGAPSLLHSQPMPSQAFGPMTRQQLAQQVANYLGVSLTFTDPTGADYLQNVTWSAKMTPLQILRFYFAQVWFDNMGNLVIGPRAPTLNAGDFQQQDEGFGDLIQLAIDTDFLILPGDQWLQYTISSVHYQLNNNPRAVCVVQQ
jgi:hypothetical protein